MHSLGREPQEQRNQSTEKPPKGATDCPPAVLAPVPQGPWVLFTL